MSLRNFYRVTYISSFLLMVGMSIFWWMDPKVAYQLRTEGHFIQNMTITFYLVGAAIAIFFILRKKLHAIYWFVPVWSIFLAGEEWSWIERMVTPPVILGKKIDSVHDFIDLIYDFFQAYTFLYALAAIILVALVVWGMRFYSQALASFFDRRQPWFLTFLSFIVLVIGQIVDVRENNTHFQKYFFEEGPENVGALLMVFAGLVLYYVNSKRISDTPD